MISPKYSLPGWIGGVLFLIVVLSLISSPVSGDQSWDQSSIQAPELQPRSATGPSEFAQQNGTIAMEHVQVAVRTSDTEIAPGERVIVSYDGVAYTSNPDSIRLQLIAVIPSGVSVSNMQAEGCNPQCPVTNNELQPGDRLRPGTFTLTADEEGSYPILIRVVYTLNNGDSQSWTRVQDISLSVQDDSPPTLVERISAVLSIVFNRVYPSLSNYFPSILFGFISLSLMYKYNNLVAERLAWSLKQGRIGADVIVFLLIVTIPISSYFLTVIIAAYATLSGDAGSGLFIALCICNCVISVIAYAIGTLLKWVELNIILLVFTLSYTILQTII